jgi:single-stranded-DNA-specific exonuclease
MRGMEQAVDVVRRTVRDRQKIRIITDYDVDGTTSSLILQAAVRLLDPAAEVSYHIPSRFGEGYGFSRIAAEKAVTDGIGLVVTADIGVRDHASVAVARSGGVDVLVCDHHLPAGESVPADATVLCPPQDGDTYPNRALAACGVSLKLAEALLGQHPRWAQYQRSMLKLAAIGTVADMVPLTTLENRAIVALGLRELNVGPHHPGLAALLRVAGLGEVRESDIGFRIGPRINAAGRVAEADLVIRLLTERDDGRARALAEQLDARNRERKDIQARLQAEALVAVGEAPGSFVVVAGREEDGWHRGVCGIVASKVREEVNRPTAVISIQGDLAVGSIRSVPGIHAVKALDTAADLLVKYGGHPMAAGFSIPAVRIDALRERLVAFVERQLPDADWRPTQAVDAEVAPDDLGEPLLRELRGLGPWGMGNAEPNLLVPRVSALGTRALGADGRILRFDVLARGRLINAVWFGRGDVAPQLTGPIDVLGRLEEDKWNGERRLQVKVVDLRLAAR